MSLPKSSVLDQISLDKWPEEIAEMKSGFAGRLKVYRVMAHHPALLKAWSDLRQHITTDSSLDRDQAEVVILRSAMHLDSIYEWSHHISRARALGMTDARIASTRGDLSDMERDDAVLSQAVDELMRDARLGPATRDMLMELVGKEGTLDVFATVGFYSTLGFIVNTFEVAIDENVAEELRTTPLDS